MNVLGEKAKAHDIAGKGELNNFVSASGPLLIENDAPRLNEIKMGLALAGMEKKLVPQDAYDGRFNDEGWALLVTRRDFVGHADHFVRKSLPVRACSGFSEFVTPTAIAIPCDGSILSPAAIAGRSRVRPGKPKATATALPLGEAIRLPPTVLASHHQRFRSRCCLLSAAPIGSCHCYRKRSTASQFGLRFLRPILAQALQALKRSLIQGLQIGRIAIVQLLQHIMHFVLRVIRAELHPNANRSQFTSGA
jgi:hypothetical protein